MFYDRPRALTLGELILLNRLKAEERMREDHVRRIVGSRGIRPHQPPPQITVKVNIRMPRVGFKGLKSYQVTAQAKLDARADQLADRIDKIVDRGMTTAGNYDKVLDNQEHDIDDMDAMVREGSNGGPLPGSG